MEFLEKFCARVPGMDHGRPLCRFMDPPVCWSMDPYPQVPILRGLITSHRNSASENRVDLKTYQFGIHITHLNSMKMSFRQMEPVY